MIDPKFVVLHWRSIRLKEESTFNTVLKKGPGPVGSDVDDRRELNRN